MFFQGLLNWLCGIAIHQMLPRPSAAGKKFSELSVEDKARRRLALSNGTGVAALAMMMLAFYNHHIPTTHKYRNYTEMLTRLVRLAAALSLPPGPLLYSYLGRSTVNWYAQRCWFTAPCVRRSLNEPGQQQSRRVQKFSRRYFLPQQQSALLQLPPAVLLRAVVIRLLSR